MARVGTSNFWGRDGTDNLINQQQLWWRQTCNKEYYKHPYNSLKIVVPQPSYHGLTSTSHEEQAKPWHVMSDQSGQQRFPRCGKHSFYYEGGDTTTPIYPFETYTSMRPPREKWGTGEIGRAMPQKDTRAVTPVTVRTGRSRSSVSIHSSRDIRDADFIPDMARDDGSLDPSNASDRGAVGIAGANVVLSARSARTGRSHRSVPASARSGRSHRSMRSRSNVSAGPARQAADMAYTAGLPWTQTQGEMGNADVLRVHDGPDLHRVASEPALSRRSGGSFRYAQAPAPSSWRSRGSAHAVHPGRTAGGFAV